MAAPQRQPPQLAREPEYFAVTDPIIEIRGLAKSFGTYRALEHVDFTIQRGEFFSLLGPSGCGKSTLLRLLAGFEAADKGEIFIDGEPMSGVPPHLRPVNMVFQSYAIFPHLDVRDNIAFGLRGRSLSRRDTEAQVQQMLETIGLPGFGKRRTSELSGGQRQRVALARALVRRPKVLLLDEPLAALDKKLRERMQLELRELQHRVGVTFVFVTHDQDEALSLSDRIAVMSRGKVHQIGRPDEIYEQPRTRFVADFIGTMNFFPATVEQVDDRLVADCGALGRVELGQGAAGRRAGEPVVLAVRPEHMRLMENPRPGTSGFGAMGQITQVSYSGDRRYLAISVPGLDQPVTLSLAAGSDGWAGSARLQGPVWVGCGADAALVLDPATT